MADMTSDDSSTEASDQSETQPEFGSDDLGRIQGILFGDHARKTNERIDTLESALLGVIADLRNEVAQHVASITERINGEADTRVKAVNNLSGRLDEASNGQATESQAIRRDLDSSVEKLTGTIDQAANNAASELEATRAELARSLEQTDLDLRDTKVDRSALAELFAATAAKLSDD